MDPGPAFFQGTDGRKRHAGVAEGIRRTRQPSIWRCLRTARRFVKMSGSGHRTVTGLIARQDLNSSEKTHCAGAGAEAGAGVACGAGAGAAGAGVVAAAGAGVAGAGAAGAGAAGAAGAGAGAGAGAAGVAGAGVAGAGVAGAAGAVSVGAGALSGAVPGSTEMFSRPGMFISSGGRPGTSGCFASTPSSRSLAAESRNSRVFTMARPIAETKKRIPSQVVNFWRMSVVCAPRAESSVPPPNAAPRPSCFGRWINTTSTISMLTAMMITVNKMDRIAMGRRICDTGKGL